MKKILFGLIITSLIILAGCSSQTNESQNDLDQNEQIQIDNNEQPVEENFEDLVSEGLIEDDESQEIGSLI